jgi:hypothetical protein
MLKENKAKLKKIYQDEYEKALKNAKVTEFNSEIERIKKKARDDAQHKVQRHSKRLLKGTKKAVKLGVAVGKAAAKARKKHGKRAKTISDNIARMNRELGL